MKIDSTVLYLYVLNILTRYPRIFALVQKFRFILMRGPLQKYFVYYFQKRSRIKPAALCAGSLFGAIDVEKAVGEINSNSYSACLQLPSEILDEINHFRDCENSHNIFHPHKRCEAVRRVALDPQIISIVRGYFRAEPIFYGSRLYYTPPRIDENFELNPKYQGKKMVHFDVADYLDICLFFYLDDVDLDTSPHILIPGTHKHKTIRDLLAGRYTEIEAKKRFGDKFTTLTGKAGFGFFEDTSAFHIQTCGRRGRATLSFCYTLQRQAVLSRHQEVF